MITIVDYGMGNLGSIVNTFKRMDIAVEISSSPEEIEKAEKIILPGVGSFDRGISNLKKMKIVPALEKSVLDKKVPILGICLGMQLFSNTSEEGHVEGLGWIDADTVRFTFDTEKNAFKIPHMGWNAIRVKERKSVLDAVNGDDRFYFVHSYHISNIEDRHVIGTTEYGYEFPSVIQKENITGIQCHPERSHKSGIKVLSSFVGR